MKNYKDENTNIILGFKGVAPIKNEPEISLQPWVNLINSHKELLKKYTHERIEKLAYQKWENAGRPEGQDKYFWEEAEKEICLKTKA